jgi:HD-GYP domain-containing protein (c-di-GMP phosphodiesterase class II)
MSRSRLLLAGIVGGILLTDARRRREGRIAERVAAAALEALLNAIDANDQRTGAHVRRVAAYALVLARAATLSERALHKVERVALFHDIGKIGIPDHVLLKPGPLDQAERRCIEKHPLIGHRLVGHIPFVQGRGIEVIRSHHERWDGHGYPDQIADDQIPLGASIIAVCDAFEAMTSARPYSDAVSAVEAVAELRRCSGSQFNPRVVEAFCELIEADASGELRAA